ncbi:hypothetical protein K458DRAFT_419516 [Lentithecium fluviatile CBS 122367]|uniref:C-type lectin domain-containing protein n=1 Tax=Lentithecium fluviatile CBS 122367 TaxID=1168545 RepID=A0A6G1IWQ0_9PLEO|nr:hypothetical protein K458DRAFT_419516 [Lentithecium fluviatile CBS 122367]
MQLISILLLVLATVQTAFSWYLRWGPLKSDRTPAYSKSHWYNLQTCQSFRSNGAKEPAPGYLWWQPNTNDNKGCCLHMYGVNTGDGLTNKNCRRLDGGHRREFCAQTPVKIYLQAWEGIGSYRILGCKDKSGKPAPSI